MADVGCRCVPQNAATVAKTELLLQNGLGLPLPVCWRILDMAEYWPQIKFTSTRKLRYSIHYHHTPPYDIELQVKVPRTPGFPAVRKVVLAIGGRSTCASHLLPLCTPCLTGGRLLPTAQGLTKTLMKRHGTHSRWRRVVPCPPGASRTTVPRRRAGNNTPQPSTSSHGDTTTTKPRGRSLQVSSRRRTFTSR